MSINGTLHLDTDLSLKSKASSLQNLQLQSAHHRPKDQPLWFSELHRLQCLGEDFAFLPVGAGSDLKGPMNPEGTVNPETGVPYGLKGWQDHQGFTIPELIQVPRIRSVGMPTGIHRGRLIALDFDGSTSVDLACEMNLPPWGFNTWHIHRDTDPWRLKLLAQLTLDQMAQLPIGPDGSIEFQGSVQTQAARGGGKGEALEVFFGGKQVVVIGEHPSSGGNYYWPNQGIDLGPEALAPLPDAWLKFVIHIAGQYHSKENHRTSKSNRTQKNGTRRLTNCPICGRHAGRGGSSLWCDETTKGLIFCMEGSTFSAEQKHGSLTDGQVIQTTQGEYQFKGRRSSPNGVSFVFAPHKQGGSNV